MERTGDNQSISEWIGVNRRELERIGENQINWRESVRIGENQIESERIGKI